MTHLGIVHAACNGDLRDGLLRFTLFYQHYTKKMRSDQKRIHFWGTKTHVFTVRHMFRAPIPLAPLAT